MKEDFETGPKSQERILARLDKMVASGRVTEAEAAGLRTAVQPEEFEAAVGSIRLRHAAARLDAAVEDGQMTRQEADGYRDGLAKGEHPRALRTHLTKLRRRSRG
ncbi:MAG: hypothetical protein ABR564_03465 [Candidatus Dormibacteria bacterium]